MNEKEPITEKEIAAVAGEIGVRALLGAEAGPMVHERQAADHYDRGIDLTAHGLTIQVKSKDRRFPLLAVGPHPLRVGADVFAFAYVDTKQQTVSLVGWIDAAGLAESGAVHEFGYGPSWAIHVRNLRTLEEWRAEHA